MNGTSGFRFGSLTARDKAWIATRRGQGYSVHYLANALGVSEADIRSIPPVRLHVAHPAPASDPMTEIGRLAPGLSDADLRRALAMLTGLVADRLGADAMLDLQSRIAASLHLPARATESVIEAVAAAHGVSVADIMGPGRTRHINHARQHAYWAVKKARPHLSDPAIGKIFGRDHTTVRHGRQAHEARMAGEGGE